MSLENNISQNSIEDKEIIGLKQIIIGYLFHWKLFLGAFVISLILGIVYLVFYPTTYQIVSVIQLQEDKDLGSAGFGLGEAAGIMKSFGLGGVSSSTINMEDELAELTSNSLVTQAVKSLGLNISYRRAYSIYKEYENSPIVFTIDPTCIPPKDDIIEFDVRSKNGKINIDVESKKIKKQNFVFEALPALIPLEGCNFILNYKNEKVQSFHIIAEYSPASWKAESLIDDFIAEELSKISNVVEISYDDYERMRALDFMNKLIELYNKQGIDFKKEESFRAVDFLSSRIDSITTALSDIEIEISKYKRLNKLTVVEADVMFYSEQMKELQIKLIELEAQSNLVSMLDSFILDPNNKYSMVPVLLSAGNEKEGVISAYNTLLLERARVIQNSNMDNPLVTSLSEQADEMRGSVFGTIRNTREGINLSLRDLKNKEALLLEKMRDFPVQEYDYLQMKRQQEIYQGIYLILLQKREELLLSIGHSKPKARVLDEAFVKAKPIGPRKLYAAIGMLLFTIIVPVVFLFGRDQFKSLLALYKEMDKVK